MHYDILYNPLFYPEILIQKDFSGVYIYKYFNFDIIYFSGKAGKLLHVF
jgi:hypothetical protein